MDSLLAQHLVNWMVLGSIYTLVALGFSLLFGVLNVIHFSHGDVSIVAPFVALAVIQVLVAGVLPAGAGWALVAALAVAILITGLLGIALDWLVIRRFRAAPAMMALVATVALGTVVRELIRMFYPQGSNPKPFPTLIRDSVQIGGLQVSFFSILVVVVSVESAPPDELESPSSSVLSTDVFVGIVVSAELLELGSEGFVLVTPVVVPSLVAPSVPNTASTGSSPHAVATSRETNKRRPVESRCDIRRRVGAFSRASCAFSRSTHGTRCEPSSGTASTVGQP